MKLHLLYTLLHQYRIHCAAFLLLAILSFALPCQAGGGPENVFLLVNPSSYASKTVANHYIDLKEIPPSNVFHIKQDESKGLITSLRFKEQILLPTLAEIDKRGLRGQIDYIVYSCGFASKVTFKKEFPNQKFELGNQPHGSITGSTYLWAFARDKRPEMFSHATNNYCLPRPATVNPKSDATTTRGFRGMYRWLPDGNRDKRLGLPYLLSAMLGVNHGRGNKTEEIVRYLHTAHQANGTKPQGTVYYYKHPGPRSTPRHEQYPQAIRELTNLGVKAQLVEDRFPQGKEDIIGLTVGVTKFSLSGSRCRLLPGALCDNFTSAGGVLFAESKQTPLTDFLLHGAAGASGTAHEPLNYPHKFPTPFLHVHYARGCSMAEAFYQSIYSPFQQLIVGDPLCQPWANFPIVNVEGLPPGKMTKGTITLTPTSKTQTGQQVVIYELYVDGVVKQRCLPDGSLSLDTTTLSDGHHELRVVAVDSSPIETQGRWIKNIEVNNESKYVQLFLENRDQLSSTKQVTVKVVTNQEKTITLTHNGRKLGDIPKGSDTVKLSAKSLGSGPITIHAQTKEEKSVFSKPLKFELPAQSPSFRKQ